MGRFFRLPYTAADIYQANFIPSKLIFSDMYQLTITTFILSFVSIIYPAWRASSIEPSETLKHE